MSIIITKNNRFWVLQEMEVWVSSYLDSFKLKHIVFWLFVYVVRPSSTDYKADKMSVIFSHHLHLFSSLSARNCFRSELFIFIWCAYWFLFTGGCWHNQLWHWNKEKSWQCARCSRLLCCKSFVSLCFDEFYSLLTKSIITMFELI
jgi:hypothetical protein